MQLIPIRNWGFRLNKIPIFLFLFTIVVLANYTFVTKVEAQTLQGELELVQRYAPKLCFKNGERFYPTSVGYIINSSRLMLRSNDGQPQLVDPNPLPSTLGKYSDQGLYLDNRLGSFEAIASDYASKAQSKGYYTYAHIFTESSSTVIQYWLFYAFNNGPLNEHQGDIEVIMVYLNSGGTPVEVVLSQHFAGENAQWADVERYGETHPVVYVALGSHANYFRPYQGKIGIESDNVGDDGLVISPENLDIVLLGEKDNYPLEQSWLDFNGRWGYWGTDEEAAQGMAGPFGPVFNQDGFKWGNPSQFIDQTLLLICYTFILRGLQLTFCYCLLSTRF